METICCQRYMYGSQPCNLTRGCARSTPPQRISEMAAYKTATLVPTCDCKTPLNVNSFDLQPEIKDSPTLQERPTEAIFVVVRGEIGEIIRHSAFHLDFVNPALKAGAKDTQREQVLEGSELSTLERKIEDKHLKFCKPENPLHFMTVWTARSCLARCRLFEH